MIQFLIAATAAWFLLSIIVNKHSKSFKSFAKSGKLYIDLQKKEKNRKKYLAQQLNVLKNSCSKNSREQVCFFLSCIIGNDYLTAFHSHNIPAYLTFK